MAFCVSPDWKVNWLHYTLQLYAIARFIWLDWHLNLNASIFFFVHRSFVLFSKFLSSNVAKHLRDFNFQLQNIIDVHRIDKFSEQNVCFKWFNLSFTIIQGTKKKSKARNKLNSCQILHAKRRVRKIWLQTQPFWVDLYIMFSNPFWNPLNAIDPSLE